MSLFIHKNRKRQRDDGSQDCLYQLNAIPFGISFGSYPHSSREPLLADTYWRRVLYFCRKGVVMENVMPFVWVLLPYAVLTVSIIIISTAVALFVTSRKAFSEKPVHTKTAVFSSILGVPSLSSMLLLLYMENQVTLISIGIKRDTILFVAIYIISAIIAFFFISLNNNKNRSVFFRTVIFILIFVTAAILCFIAYLIFFVIFIYRG